MKYVKLPALAILPFMLNACGQPEPLRTVSDFCLNDKVVMFNAAPKLNENDPANFYDTDQTVEDLIAHNAVHRRLCLKPDAP